jgi:hypothetical protein
VSPTERAYSLARELWVLVKMDTVQDAADWRVESERIISAVLQAERQAVWDEAANVAHNHACGDDDDIICQHQNCAAIIEHWCRVKAKEAQP